MTVKFRDPVGAQACVLVSPTSWVRLAPQPSLLQKMNGRFFAERRIEASLYIGKQRFKRSGAGDDVEGDTDEAEKRRLDDFANWLMTEGD